VLLRTSLLTRWGVVAGFVLLIIVLADLVFPAILLRTLNHRLSHVPGYDGHIQSLDLGWIRGRMVFHEVRFEKREDTAPGAFVSADRVVADLSWLQLLHGYPALTLDVEKGAMRFRMRERRVGQEKPVGVWRKPFTRTPALRVERITFHDGRLQFQNADAIPPIDIYFENVQLTGSNLSNRAALLSSSATHIQGTARMQGQAPLFVDMTVYPFQDQTAFTVAGRMQDFDLTAMNPIMHHYTRLRLKTGTLRMSVDLTAEKGFFGGQVSRSIDRLAIQKSPQKPLKRIKESVAQAWINSKKEDDRDRIETHFEYSGPLGYLDQDVVLAAVWIVKAAFIQALNPKVENKVVGVLPEQALDQWALFQQKEREKAGRP